MLLAPASGAPASSDPRPAAPSRAAPDRRRPSLASGGRTGPAVLPLPPSQVQVRPARHGWRLVTADAAGRWLASANGDGIITAWLAGSGQPVRSWSAGARVRAMAAGPDDLLVVATDDGRVTGLGRRDRDRLPLPARYRSRPHRPGGPRPRLSPSTRSGSWLAASVDGRLLLWDVADPGEPLLAAELPVPRRGDGAGVRRHGLAAGHRRRGRQGPRLGPRGARGRRARERGRRGRGVRRGAAGTTRGSTRPAPCRTRAGRIPAGCWRWPGMTRAIAGSASARPARTAGRRPAPAAATGDRDRGCSAARRRAQPRRRLRGDDRRRPGPRAPR